MTASNSSLRRRTKKLKRNKEKIEHYKTQLNNQNDYILELEARIEELLKSDEETKALTPDAKGIKSSEIEMIIKDSKSDPDPSEEVIDATNNSSNKKGSNAKEEIEYVGGEKFNLDTTPRERYNLKPKKQNMLHSSLPKGVQDASYFDINEQRQSLLKDLEQKEERDFDVKAEPDKITPFGD